jgi:hypothetical protein
LNAQDQLRQVIDEQKNRLLASVSSVPQAAILALIRTIDRLPRSAHFEPDLVTGRRLANLSGNRALQLCLESTPNAEKESSSDELNAWAERFLWECDQLAEAELVLAHCETGFMRIVENGNGMFDSWIATKRTPTSWRERADIDWWASSLAKRLEPELSALRSETTDAESDDNPANYRRLASIHLELMAYQIGYPPDAEIGGCSVQIYRDVLSLLIGWALQAQDRGEKATTRSESSLVDEIASALAADPIVISKAINAFTLEQANAAYHAAVPGVAAAPLVRIGADQLVWSVYGLMTEPFFFLTRELKRRDAQGYHNSAYLREAVFRQDLYELFQDKRFVTSSGRIELRRDVGDVRTDIDAAVFDRKTGTLGLFELKSQDPFARSTAELTRQRDNFLYANRQISGVLTWLIQHRPDELLVRVDARAAKTFRVQKVYPFVLGRYLARFNDGPEPDRRAAWGTWTQLLRLFDGQSIRATAANPIASLFSRLTKDVPDLRPPADTPPREIDLGAVHLIVYPSYGAYQAQARAS